MLKRSMILGVLALSLSACGANNDTAIRIGIIGPLTGDAASYGIDAANGAAIAVQELNELGGINGRRVELVSEDGQCNGAGGLSAAQKLVNVDRVSALLVGCSSEVLAAAQIAEAKHIPLVSTVASAPTVTLAGDYIFRVYPSDALKAPAFKKYFAKNGFKKLAIISENTDFAQGVRSALAQELATGETTIVFDEVVPQGTKDFRSLLTRLKKTEFDVFLPNTQGDANLIEAIKQFRTLGFQQQIVGTDVADSNNIGITAPVESEGLKALSMPGLDESNPEAKRFATIFRSKYLEPRQGMFFAATGYDSVMVLAQTMKSTASVDGEKVKQALYGLKYSGLIGNISFDMNGDVKGLAFAMKVFKNGALEQSELVPLE